jgi:hypothetical protein
LACLGRQVQARTTNELKRRLYSRICHGPAGDCTVTLQCPIKRTLLPQGASTGRRERESRREGRREQSLRGHSASPSRVVAVESILVVWKASPFAGWCRNEGLGRSVDCAGFPPCTRRADDSECSEDAEEGNVRQHAPQSVCTRGKHERSSLALTRTRPSLGPSTRACQSSLCTQG